MFERFIILACVSIVLSCLGSQVIRAQDGPPITVDTSVLRIPTFVSGSNGKGVRGLTKHDFELTVNGQRQKIDFFDNSGPINIAIVIDSNSNTSEVIERMRRDAQRLVDLLHPEDRALIVSFNVGYRLECELTSDRSKLKRAIGGIDTSRDRIRIMTGVVHQVIFREFAGVEGRKAVVLFADPDSNLPPFGDGDREYLSRAPVKDDWANIARSGVAVFPIFYQTATFPREHVGRTLTLSQLVKIPGLDYFNHFATLTGGRFYAAGASNFKSALEQIVDEVRSQYILSFYVDDVLKGSTILIKTTRSEYSVRAKQKVGASSSGTIKSSVSRLWNLRKK